MVGTNAGISAALSLYDYDQSNFRRNLGTVSSLGAPTNARSTTASLGQQASRPFQTDPGNKTGRISIGFRPNMELCWVGSVRLAELHWQRRQVYRLRGFNWIRSSGSGGSGGPEKTSEPGFWCGSRRRIEASCPGLVGTHPSPISREPSFHRPSLRAAVWPGSTRTPSRLSLAWLGFSGRLCKAMGTRRKFDRSGSGGVFRVAPGDGDGYCFG